LTIYLQSNKHLLTKDDIKDKSNQFFCFKSNQLKQLNISKLISRYQPAHLGFIFVLF